MLGFCSGLASSALLDSELELFQQTSIYNQGRHASNTSKNTSTFQCDLIEVVRSLGPPDLIINKKNI